MKISLDYDDTFTKDPSLWLIFIETAIERGHEVWCVSARNETHMDDIKVILGPYLTTNRCVGTSGAAKADFMWDNYDVIIDVWIDDNPQWVNQGIDCYTTATDYYDLGEFKSSR